MKKKFLITVLLATLFSSVLLNGCGSEDYASDDISFKEEIVQDISEEVESSEDEAIADDVLSEEEAAADDVTSGEETTADDMLSENETSNSDFTPIDGTEFTFLDGKMTVVLSEDDYDVLVADNDPDSPALSHQGLTKEKADLYMSLIGYALKACPVGETITNSDLIFEVNIKEPNYAEIGTLKSLTEAEQDVVASALTSGFKGVRNGYQWFRTDSVDWIVFDCDMSLCKETRYATIYDGRMIYVFFSRESDYPSEEDALILHNIVQNIKWN